MSYFFTHYIINNTSFTNWHIYNFMNDINDINNDITNDIIEQLCYKPDGLLVKNDDWLLVENLVRHVSRSFFDRLETKTKRGYSLLEIAVFNRPDKNILICPETKENEIATKKRYK